MRRGEFSCPRWQFVSLFPIAVQGGAVALKCSHKMGVRADSFENLRAFQAFQMNLISVGSISLDSSFKRFYFEFIY
jgi:hypothetical protein